MNEILEIEKVLESPTSIPFSCLTRPLLSELKVFNCTHILDVVQNFHMKGLINTYIFNVNNITLVFNPHFFIENGKQKAIKDFELFKSELLNNPLFLEEVVIGENIGLTFIFPHKWRNEYNSILKGEYSKVSSEYIDKFYPSKECKMFLYKWKPEEAKEYFAKKFNVNKTIFNECELGPKIEKYDFIITA